MPCWICPGPVARPLQVGLSLFSGARRLLACFVQDSSYELVDEKEMASAGLVAMRSASLLAVGGVAVD